MSLQLSNFPKFRADIQSKETQLVPLVVLGDYYISTNSQAVTVDGEAVAPLPILLNVPSLKESIDIDKRNFRISSVTLQLSNFTYDNVRFSDRVGNNSLINKECKIYWTSPSATTIDGEGDDNAFLIYDGILRKYQHSDEKVTLTIEDMSQSKLHKDLPLQENYLGTDESIPSKYRNKPIPMVYGHVDRSPCVINANYASVIADSDVNITYNYGGATDDTFSDIASPLYMHMDMGGMLNVLKGGVGDQNTDFESYTEQFSIIDNKIFLNFNNPLIFPIDLDSSDNSSHILCLDSNKSFALNITTLMPDLFQAAGLPSDYWGPDLTGQDMFTSDQLQEMSDSSLSSNQVSLDLSGYVYKTASLTQGQTYIQYLPVITFMFNYSPTYDHTSANVRDFIINGSSIKTIIGTGDFIKTFTGSSTFEGDLFTSNSQIEALFNYDTSGGFSQSIPIQFHFPHGGIDEYDNINYFTSAKSGRVVFRNSGDTFSFTFEKALKVGYSGFSQGPATLHPFNFELEADLAEFSLSRVVEVEKIFENEFYADVQGRISNSPTSIQVIKSILLNELGYFGGVNEPSDSSYNWQYAFTINKKINSKKLIEGIASVSPYLPRFDNMGKFTFDEIKKVYGTEYFNSDSSVEQAINIKALDVIDYSFSRTDIENVYTKVIFKYNWDYAKEEFLGTAEAYIDNNEQKMKKFIDPDGGETNIDNPPTTFPEYQHDYYGFKTILFGGINVSHEDSTLVIDDDRGKYIRNETTAGSFASWFLEWHCNQHLKMKVKLPLSYMNIEIGKLVCFDEVIGDVKPYGIDYHKNALFLIDTDQVEGYDREGIGDVVNGQQVFPIFMVIATNKKLDNIEIECIQMHNLENTLIGTDVIFGCTRDNSLPGNEGVVNYNPEATHSLPNACLEISNFEVPYCAYEYHTEGGPDDDILDYADDPRLDLAYINPSDTSEGRLTNGEDGIGGDVKVFFVGPVEGDETLEAVAYWQSLDTQTRQNIIESSGTDWEKTDEDVINEGNSDEIYYRQWAPRIFRFQLCNWTQIAPAQAFHIGAQFITYQERYGENGNTYPVTGHYHQGGTTSYVRYTSEDVQAGSRVEHYHYERYIYPSELSCGETPEILEDNKIRLEIPLTREMREDLIWMRDHPFHWYGVGQNTPSANIFTGETEYTENFHYTDPNYIERMPPRPLFIVEITTSPHMDDYVYTAEQQSLGYNTIKTKIDYPEWPLYSSSGGPYNTPADGVIFSEEVANCDDLRPAFAWQTYISSDVHKYFGFEMYHPAFKEYGGQNKMNPIAPGTEIGGGLLATGYGAGGGIIGDDNLYHRAISRMRTYDFHTNFVKRQWASSQNHRESEAPFRGYNNYRVAIPNFTLRDYYNEGGVRFGWTYNIHDGWQNDQVEEFISSDQMSEALFRDGQTIIDFDNFHRANYQSEPLEIELKLSVDMENGWYNDLNRTRARGNHIEIVFYTPESEADEDEMDWGESGGGFGGGGFDGIYDGPADYPPAKEGPPIRGTGNGDFINFNVKDLVLMTEKEYDMLDILTMASCSAMGDCKGSVL